MDCTNLKRFRRFSWILKCPDVVIKRTLIADVKLCINIPLYPTLIWGAFYSLLNTNCS
jgi:hypothetical protein